MESFIKLIENIHKEQFDVVMNKIVSEKIPTAFLSLAPFESAVEFVKNLRKQNLNVTHLIISQAPPLDTRLSDFEFDVTSLENFSKLYPQPEFILTLDVLSPRLAVKRFPNCKVLSFAQGSRNFIYDIFMNNLSELKKVYESLIDDESKKTFCGYWLGNISNQISKIHYSNNTHYITAGFLPEEGGIVIDAGACDGTTAAKFAELGYKVYAFEMDKKNFELAKKVAKEKKFTVENFGLGSFKHKTKYSRFENNIGGSHFDVTGDEVAEITTIDSYVREKKLPRVDFIKMDVEGAELEVLQGASTTIAKFKPILNLSAYHKWEDFWTLMNFVKSIRSDYEFALRLYPEISEESQFVFTSEQEEFLYSLGLEPRLRWFNEVCLLAR